MMELPTVSKISAEGVLGEYAYDVEFDDSDRMRVIYAPNGRGKTNFLRAINLLLQPSPDSLQALIDIPVRLLTIEFSSGAAVALSRGTAFGGAFVASAWSGTQEEPVIDVAVEPGDFSSRYYRRAWDERQDYLAWARSVEGFSTGAVLIGDDRLSLSVDDLREMGRGESSYALAKRRAVGTVGRLLERVERMLTQTALAGMSLETGSSGVYADIARNTLEGAKPLTAARARLALESQIAALLDSGAGYEQYGLLSLRQVRDIHDQLDLARANDRRISTLHRILTPYFESLQDQVNALGPAQRLIDTFVTAVNTFLDGKSMEFSARRGIRLLGRDGSVLHPDVLSSGERHLLFLLSQAVLATEARPFVIVDEPELSLGIDWQRDLLEELLRCTASAGVQFLVASHSVQVMGRLSRESIITPREDL
jgi:ABC-type lipoprotein export system ATPase subunit